MALIHKPSQNATSEFMLTLRLNAGVSYTWLRALTSASPRQAREHKSRYDVIAGLSVAPAPASSSSNPACIRFPSLPHSRFEAEFRPDQTQFRSRTGGPALRVKERSLLKTGTSQSMVCGCFCYCVMPFIKLKPLGVPTPVTLSQLGPVVSDVSVPKVITNQRVEWGLL